MKKKYLAWLACMAVVLSAALPPAAVFAAGSSGPATTVTAPAFSTNQSSSLRFKVSWAATSAVSYEIQQKTGAGGVWTAWLTNTTATASRFLGSGGRTYYFRGRAKNAAGKTGRWSGEAITVVPFNQSVATYTGAWYSTPKRRAFFRRTAKFASVRGSRAVRAFSGAKEVSLIVTKRPRGGLADVYIGRTKVGVVDFYAPTVTYRVPTLVKTFAAETSGRLKVVVKHAKSAASGGYRVELDGIAIKK